MSPQEPLYTFVTLKPRATTLHIMPPARTTHTACGKAKPLMPPLAIHMTRAAADKWLTSSVKVCASCDRMRAAATMGGPR